MNLISVSGVRTVNLYKSELVTLRKAREICHELNGLLPSGHEAQGHAGHAVQHLKRVIEAMQPAPLESESEAAATK